MPGLFLKNVDQMQQVEWSRSFLWDVKFYPGKTFSKKANGIDLNTWFPATSVEENVWTLDTHPFNGGNSTFEIPKSTTLFNLKISFVDDVHLTVEKFITSWVNDEIFGTPGATQCLEEACKKVDVVKLTNKNEIVSMHSYWVFPKGAMNYHGTSDSAVLSDDIEFIIAGTIKAK